MGKSYVHSMSAFLQLDMHRPLFIQDVDNICTYSYVIRENIFKKYIFLQ